jgi:hypothetical protein
MRPAPSLHYVSTLLDQRRRRYHRGRRLWGSGLLLLGLGLLLLGGWRTLRRTPSATPQAAAVSPAGRSALPSGATGMRMRAVEPRWAYPVLLEPGACQDCPCQTLPPWRTACALGDVVASGCPTLLWCMTEPARRPWELALPERGPLPVQTGGALAAPTPPGLPEHGDHPPASLSSSSCAAAPCPAVPAVGRPAATDARPSQRRRPRGRRPVASRKPAQPVPSQQRMSDDVPLFRAEPEAEPERLTASP